ncbi:MAG: nucleoside triphosphate pyrophosphohydrolase [Candidatus Schekmanbacteria bacterium]|nr:nucleoside triphosphate pyrophosphohydrolase [Candidatus Schekmanbacteria bacterium]
MEKNNRSFDRTVEIMEKLRSPEGCPWDKEQTTTSLKPYLVEEAYEVLEAIDSGSPHKLKEELGDLLLQVVFHSQIASEEDKFTIDDVLKNLNEKLVRRHPHVFDDLKLSTPKEVLANWETIKKNEKNSDGKASVLEGIPRSLPSLLFAFTLQKRVARVGFDWENVEGAQDKLLEEIKEFEQSVAKMNPVDMEEELGDILFSIVNVARFYGLHPEEALKKTCMKFIKRFQYIEEKAGEEGKELEGMSLEEMDKFWNEAKKV